MHVAFITLEYPHPDLSRSGGLGTSIKNLAKGLVLEGVTVTVFVLGQLVDKQVDDSGIRLMSLAKQEHFAFNWYLERKRYQHIIQKYIDSEKIDLIEAPDWTGVSAFMKFTVPLIIRLNGSDGYFCHLDGRPQKWKHRFLERTALKHADAIVSVSSFTSELTKKIFGLNTQIRIIHNSINADDFKPLGLKVKHGQLLYFGTLIRKKGVLELAHVFNRVVEKKSNATLLMVGKDAVDVFEKRSTFELFNSLLTGTAKTRVHYIREVPYKEVQRYIAESHIVLLPSFAEAFPMTWLETLAMEKPLISSDVGWANELMIDGVTGYTVDPKKHELFAEKIITLLDNQQLCHSFGIAGRQHVIAQFSTDIITQKNIAFYKDYIKA